jgi:DNA-binding transcriptional regulator PaaX
VPTGQNARRERLRRYLRGKAFGCLQMSVWITPDPLQAERDLLAGGKVDVGSLILLEARPCADESDADIVAGAWDFEHINHCYARHLEVLERRPNDSLRDATAAKSLRQWAAAERQAWLEATSADPLLPERLLPPDYLGRQAWRRRLEMFNRAGQQLRTFTA